MISSGALPLNAILAFFYLLVAGAAMFVLKKSYRPLTRFSKPTQKTK